MLLRTNSDLREAMCQSYQHVLVDEYQDINRASGILLREIVGAGTGLWVVGDARQAIYRFRGASPVNMRRFHEDFPDATIKVLQRNYRSQPPIIDVFSGMAPTMRAAQSGPPFTPWEAVRQVTAGRVLMEIADNLTAETNGLAREIKLQREAGIDYRDQAVLCRSHTYLGRIAAQLERAGVPVLYLGDLFERSEVRDMLALLALACEPDGTGLVRVGRFPEYQIPLADIRVLLKLASEQEVPFPRALELAQNADSISLHGKTQLGRLTRHLDSLCYGTHPWTLLTQYLFNRSNYLDILLSNGSIPGQQQRLALYQFLQFAHERHPAGPGEAIDPKRRLLQYVRRLEIFGEEKQLRQVPSWADGMDAVRLLTVHASKGLEFDAVYLPALGQGIFPARRQGQSCPPPIGMLPTDDDDHDEEEECLFFVALSRARNVLCLSRAQGYEGSRASNPSKLLLMIARHLPNHPGGPVTWSSSVSDYTVPVDPPALAMKFPAETLDVYLKCPRQFFYEFVLGLSGKREDSAYVQFHLCVYRVLHWMADERMRGQLPDAIAALTQLTETWEEHGPRNHPYESLYHRAAMTMVLRAVNRPTRSHGPAARPTWEVPLPRGHVQFTPDHVETLDDGTEIVERLRTGRPSKSEQDKDIYALYQVAARDASPRVKRRVQIRYLSTDQVEPVNLSQKKVSTRLGRYNSAIAGIQREAFPPQPSDRVCPRCPHYFICPLAEDV